MDTLSKPHQPSVSASMFENASDFTINNGTFNSAGRDFIYNINSTDQFRGLYRLYKSMSTSAMYSSETQHSPARCHEGTREAILSRLSQWIIDYRRDSQICWLYGSAGVGKSSVAQTVAERSARAENLAASFFFWREDPTRNNARRFVPTIAFQLANAIPTLRPAINSVVESNYTILDAPLEDQFQSLILQPFENIDHSEVNFPLLVILDGLDECIDGRSQERVLLTIADGLNSGQIPLIFLVTSRPEPRIRKVFESVAFRHICSRLALEDSDEDIRKYLLDGLSEIYSRRMATTARHIQQPWPTPKQLDDLVYKASGQFIFASTVLKFVDDDYSVPSERLRAVLDLADSEERHDVDHPVNEVVLSEPESAFFDQPLGELDRLYRGILSANPNSKRLVRILGTIVVFHEIIPPSTGMLEELLALQPGEVAAALSGMHSLLKATSHSTQTRSHLDSVEFAHKSFPDFLLDSNRSGRYFIELQVHHGYLARRCLKLMLEKSLLPTFPGRMQVWGLRPLVRLKPFTYALGQELVYYCNWAYHCVSATTSPELMLELRKMDVHAYANHICMLEPNLQPLAFKSIVQVGIFIGEVNRVKRWAENHKDPPRDLIERFQKFSSIGFYISCHCDDSRGWNKRITTLGNFLAFHAVIPDIDLGFDLYTSEDIFCQIMGCDQKQLSDLKCIFPLKFSAEPGTSPHSSHHTKFVDLADCHATLAVHCIQILIHDNDSFLYAKRYWCKHLTRAYPRPDLMEYLEQYIRSGQFDNDTELIHEVMQWSKKLPLEVCSSTSRMLFTILRNILHPGSLEIENSHLESNSNSDIESDEDVFFDCEEYELE